MAYDNTQGNTASGQALPLGGRAEILPMVPVPDVKFAGGPCCAARYKNDTSANLVAVVCTGNLPPRYDGVNSLKTVDHPSLLKLVDSGIVSWPVDQSKHFAFAYARPTAPLMAVSNDQTFQVMGEDALTHYFVMPMVGALLELTRVGMVHNGIRPANIYWRFASATPPQLGEFLSVPPGYDQAPAFETIERAMTDPVGRGLGSHADDCYAFGVTLAILMLGHNPFQGLDANAIIQAKLDRGSFIALVGNSRLSGSNIELLRGLLTDDQRQRWSVSDIDQWLKGRRQTPKGSETGRRASRHIDFNGKEIWQARQLGVALPVNTAEGLRQVEEGSIDRWLRRAVGDETSAERLAAAKNSLKDTRTAHREDQVVTRAAIALDPQGPIRYRGVSVMPMGMAAMLVDAVTANRNIGILVEIISSQLVTFWVEMQKDPRSDILPLAQQFERMRGYIEKISLGNGVERALYQANPGLPCLSPMLKNDYVTVPKALLAALERVAKSGSGGREPVDRHIAAFLVVHDRRPENTFDNIAAPDDAPRKGIALIGLFADLQVRYGPESLPALAQWILPFLEVSTRRFLSKTLREKTQNQLREAAERGDLTAMQRLVDDTKRVTYDKQGFMAARMLYLATTKEIAHIEATMVDRDSVAQSVGKPIAASVASFIAILFVLLAIIRAVWQNLN